MNDQVIQIAKQEDSVKKTLQNLNKWRPGEMAGCGTESEIWKVGELCTLEARQTATYPG